MAAHEVEHNVTEAQVGCRFGAKVVVPKLAALSVAGPSLQWGPNLPRGSRTVRLNFHVIQKADGTGSFPSDLSITRPIFEKIVEFTNWHFARLERCTLPSSTTYEPDARVRFRLTGIYFHPDDPAWNFGTTSNQCSSYWYTNFGVNKGKDLNVFWHGLQPGNCAGGAPGFFLQMLKWYTTNDPNDYSTAGNLLAHELAHCLGLHHTFNMDDVPDSPPEDQGGWVDPDSVSVSNNIAGYTKRRTFLSRMQLEKVHGNLRSVLSGLCDLRVAPPSPKGLAAVADSPIFTVDGEGDLLRMFWGDNRWNAVSVASPHFACVQGSAMTMNVGGSPRVFAVTDRYEVAMVAPDGTGLQSIGGPGIVPGSLVEGVSNELFGVDLDRKLVRVQVPAGTSTIVTTSFRIAAGSLILVDWGTNGKRVFGVSEGYGAFSHNGSNVLVVTGVKAVPGSMVDGGASGVLGVDKSRNLIQITRGSNPNSAVTHSLSSIGGVEPGSLVVTSLGVFGVTHGNTSGTPAHVLVRLLNAGGTLDVQVYGTLQTVVPGSLVNGYSHGIFGVTFDGDLVRFHDNGGTMQSSIIAQWGGRVVAGSLISTLAVEGGRVYGINEAGAIIGTWLDGGAIAYSILQ